MALGNIFKLEKLKIMAYGNRRRIGLPIGVFEAMFNPESFKRKYAIQYGKYQGINMSGRPLTYAKSVPSDLSLTLILDGTGVNQMGIAQLLPQKSVSKRIEQFLDVAYYLNGDIHQPNYLVVKWADLSMPCRLGSVDIHYTHFDRDGKPLRASLDILLTSDESSDLLKKKERKSSPDLSHSRIVKAGDTLPLLTKEIYGSSEHYLWVAQANGLDEFRRLTPGQRLVFPPLEPKADA